MKNRYSRAIERVEVTAEMRDRIMKNIGGAELNSGSPKSRETFRGGNLKSKAPSFRAYRRYISIAACFILLLIGAFVVYSSLKPPVVVKPPVFVECASLGELSETVGFKVREVKTLPFSAEQTAYTALLGDVSIAQVRYTGEGNELSFRMSAGGGDNSGDYTEYSDIKSSSAGSLAVTLKGNGGQYNLAVWQDGGYSYSVRIAIGDSGTGVSEEEMLGVVASVE